MQQELHPFEQSAQASRFRVTANWQFQSGKLRITSRCEGPVQELDFNRAGTAVATHELWKQTCFECFLLKSNSTEYVEWNFSPGEAFQRYHFTNYRERITTAPEPTTRDFDIHWLPGLNAIEAELQLPLRFDIQKFQITWVLKTKTGETTYWALAHPPAKPDFHNFSAMQPVPR